MPRSNSNRRIRYAKKTGHPAPSFRSFGDLSTAIGDATRIMFVRDAAELLGVSPQSIYEAIRKGKLAGWRTDRAVYADRRAVEDRLKKLAEV